eukprot:CAMPEP_0175151980 /NCGR_PEP_ID=MMETSP0087-20121206/18838_1 /TAXON_ID=136419 /ORGANISM="Unknown Unknown, Strain D1" /LENGTH=114 /DNA_ID=CAMNT_0016438319 /DNA_START=204 /DNA_END=545 /DNA_ORIENTATION=-
MQQNCFPGVSSAPPLLATNVGNYLRAPVPAAVFGADTRKTYCNQEESTVQHRITQTRSYYTQHLAQRQQFNISVRVNTPLPAPAASNSAPASANNAIFLPATHSATPQEPRQQA